MKFYVTVKQSNVQFITKFGWNTLENDNIMLFQPRQPPFLSVRASCRTDWTLTGSLRRLSGPQALQIWNHWTITSGVPCWKCTINSRRTQDDWWVESRLADHLGRAATRTHQQGSGELHQALDCLHGCGCRWWSLRAFAVTLVSLQVCILISSPTNRLFSEPPTPTDYQWRQCLECREIGAGVVLVETAYFVILQYVSTKLGCKGYIGLFKSCVKFHAQIFMHCWNINKSCSWLHFMSTLYIMRPQHLAVSNMSPHMVWYGT